MGKPKNSYEKVAELFGANGYTLVDTVYKNNRTRLHAKCANGHDCFIRYNDLQQGHGCSDCSGTRKKVIEEVRSFFEKEGYSLISTEYVNSTTPLHVKCPKGHESYPVYGNFQQGERCLDCSGHKTKTIEEVRSIFEKEGYRLISTEYERNKEHLYSICPKGHDCFVAFSKFQDGRRCSSCQNNGTSKPEIELFEIIKKIIPSVKKLRDRKVKIEGKPYIHGFDIDILAPELNLGIEFDGPYHHSFEYMRKDPKRCEWTDEDIRNYHEIKDAWFATKGIAILHIEWDDWKQNKESCINRCLEFLGLSTERAA